MVTALRSALIPVLLLATCLLAAFVPPPPPPPPPTTYQFLSPVPVNSQWYNVMVVSPTAGAMYAEGQVAREVRAPRALPGLTKITGTITYGWDADALGAENLSGQMYPWAFQQFRAGLVLRIKPTTRFPADVVLGSTLDVAFQQPWQNVSPFDGALDCGGASGESWPGYWWMSRSIPVELTDPHILARFVAGDPNDPGYVRLQFVGPPAGSDWSTWSHYDSSWTYQPPQWDGHGWKHRWELVQVGLCATFTYQYAPQP